MQFTLAMLKLWLILRSIYIWVTVLSVMIVLSTISILFSLFDRSGTVYLFLARLWCRLWLFFSGVRLIVIGKENVNPNGVYVVVSNHASYFDIPALLLGLPIKKVRIVAKESLGKIPFFGWSMAMGDFILIKRGANRDALKSLYKAIEKIRQGKSVIIFADGTRSFDGRIQPFKRGAFLVAEKSGVPILPVTILGSYKIMRRGTALISPGSITLVIDRAIPVESKSADELLTESFRVISANHQKFVQQGIDA
ncbi:MAG: lysophospholipid acyltransferase family protein [Chloroherpetonaceae bacterium]|nr:lysophospholipid acyltransferase family protein [Chloroherpetonaceae bacterium]